MMKNDAYKFCKLIKIIFHKFESNIKHSLILNVYASI